MSDPPHATSTPPPRPPTQARRLPANVVVNSGNDLPESAAVATARAIWRYRSELTPIAVAIGTVGAATTLHRAHQGAWPWLAIATLAFIAALAIPLPAWARKAWAVLDRLPSPSASTPLPSLRRPADGSAPQPRSARQPRRCPLSRWR